MGSLKSVSMHLGGNRRWVPLLYVQCINCGSNIIIRLLRNIRILGIIFIGLKKRVHTKESISIIQLKLLLILRKKKKHTNYIKPIE